MASPEHIFHRPHIFFSSVNDSGDSPSDPRGLENSKIGSTNQPDLKRWPQTGGYPPGSEEYRQFKTSELGLPETATWGEIADYLNQQDMLTIARELGFSEEQMERVSWYSILAEGMLGLSGNEPIEDIIHKIKSVKNEMK